MERNKQCPKCHEAGHDKTGDHFYLMLDGKTWTCDRDFHDPYYERDGVEWVPGKTKVASGPVDVSEFAPMQIRDIQKDIIDKYGIKVECDGGTGKPIKHYYPITKNRGRDIVAWKIRKLPKDFAVQPSVGKTKVDLFGMKSSPFAPKTIIITEGELDAPAAYQMLHKSVHKLMVVALPFGANMKAVMNNMDFLQEADDLLLCPDQDDAGLDVIEKMSMMLPNIRIMRFSEKDPCDMMAQGKTAGFKDAYKHAKTRKPSSIVAVCDLEADALEPVPYGLDYPFAGLTKLTYGLPLRSIIGIGAGPGAGKTTFVKAIMTHLLFTHKKKIGIFAFEERPSQTLRSLAGHIIGKPVHLPDCVYDEDDLADAIASLRDLVHIYDHHGYRDWKDVSQAMLYMAHQGVEFQFIDPLSALTAHLSAGDANTYLNNAMFTMSKLVQSTEMSIFHVNHLNNPQSGADHGAGGKVYGSQFTGSRAMWKFSTDLWGLERNQLADTEQERNKVRVPILKNRLSGVNGSVLLTYNHAKGRLEETGAAGAAASGFIDADATAPAGIQVGGK
jgi:twinkle protein